MFAPIVVLWLGATVPLPEQRAEIVAWAEARELTPVAPAPESPERYQADVVGQIEALLEEARSAAAAPGAAGSASAVERAEALLLAHPELPQGAWLMAERYAVEAQALGASAASVERRRTLLGLSRALDGGRAPPAELDGGFSAAPDGAPSSQTGSHEAPSSEAPPPARGPRGSAARLGGARPHDEPYVDGMPGAALAPGRHHVQLYRGGRRVGARWIDTTGGEALAVDDAAGPCSALDLADVAALAERPRPAPGVRCRRWLVARPAALGGTEIAECAAARCGRWQLLRPLRASAASSGSGEEATAWPGWATWGLLGAGAFAAAGIVLWQVGAFERPAAETEFVFTGPDATGYRF
jgi:hypothetical protein